MTYRPGTEPPQLPRCEDADSSCKPRRISLNCSSSSSDSSLREKKRSLMNHFIANEWEGGELSLGTNLHSILASYMYPPISSTGSQIGTFDGKPNNSLPR